MTAPAADAGLSTWWPTPVRPADHFSADELARSAELHGPVRRVRRELAISRVACLAGAGLVLGADPVGDRLADSGSLVRSLVGAVAVVLAIRGPEMVARWRLARLDAVQRVGMGSAGSRDPDADADADVDAVVGGLGGPWSGLPGAAVGSILTVLALALVARFLLGPLTRPTTGWMLAIALAAVATGITLVATAVRAARSDELTAPQPWGDLLHRAGLGPEVGLGVLVQPDDGGVGAPNACAVGIAGRRWILVDPSLLAGGTGHLGEGGEVGEAGQGGVEAGASSVPGPIGAFIVAHEATHLARRHPEVQVAVHAVTLGLALGAIPLLAAVDRPWTTVGLEPDDPVALPVAVLAVLVAAAVIRLPAAWVLRGLERSADAGAVELVGVPDRGAARVLHLQAGGELAPPWWSQLTAVRPSPAERLEFLARCRRSVRNQDRRPLPGRAPRRTLRPRSDR